MRDHLTRGRRHPEKAHPYRSEYQRDRDRIIHSKAFRRLEKKTQVFDPNYSDHFRNRLTHTLEVSQISRTISEALGLNTDLSEVLALSHDIGHPPFSHEGERVLDRLMKHHGSGFDHNLHAIRIVEDFEEKYPGFRGLNLTYEVREGIVKHSSDWTEGEELYLSISEYSPGHPPLLEAQLIDLADEIAYNTADLDDGYDSGLLTLEQIMEAVGLFNRLFLEVESDYRGVVEKLKVRETVRRIIDVLVTSMVSESRSVLEIKGIDSVESVRQSPVRLLRFQEQVAVENRQLKRFLREYLYDHQEISRSRHTAQKLLEDLFSHYLEHPDALPQGHKNRIPERGIEGVICDYLAGMTDQYAQSQHRKLFEVSQVTQNQ